MRISGVCRSGPKAFSHSARKKSPNCSCIRAWSLFCALPPKKIAQQMPPKNSTPVRTALSAVSRTAKYETMPLTGPKRPTESQMRDIF